MKMGLEGRCPRGQARKAGGWGNWVTPINSWLCAILLCSSSRVHDVCSAVAGVSPPGGNSKIWWWPGWRGEGRNEDSGLNCWVPGLGLEWGDWRFEGGQRDSSTLVWAGLLRYEPVKLSRVTFSFPSYPAPSVKQASLLGSCFVF